MCQARLRVLPARCHGGGHVGSTGASGDLTVEPVAEPVSFDVDDVLDLQVEPEPRRRCEGAGQAQCRIDGHGPLAVPDLVEVSQRDANVRRPPERYASRGFEELRQEHNGRLREQQPSSSRHLLV